MMQQISQSGLKSSRKSEKICPFTMDFRNDSGDAPAVYINNVVATDDFNPFDKNGIKIPSSIYFGGCAWGSAFYVGVYRALCERWPGFQDKILVTGDSAGCIFAAAVAHGLTPAEIESVYVDMSEAAHRSMNKYFGPIRQFSEHSENSIRRIIKNPTAHKDLHGRFGLGTTEFPARHVWHWSWESTEDLVNCMHGSMSFPLYCEEMRFVNGGVVLDGAYSMAGTDFPEGDNTLFIGIDPNAEITRTFTNRQMLFPLIGEEYEDIARSGYDAMMKWDGTMKKKIGKRFPNYPALTLLWSVRIIELILLFICNVLYFWPVEYIIKFLKCCGLYRPIYKKCPNEDD